MKELLQELQYSIENTNHITQFIWENGDTYPAGKVELIFENSLYHKEDKKIRLCEYIRDYSAQKILLYESLLELSMVLSEDVINASLSTDMLYTIAQLFKEIQEKLNLISRKFKKISRYRANFIFSQEINKAREDFKAIEVLLLSKIQKRLEVLLINWVEKHIEKVSTYRYLMNMEGGRKMI